MPTGRVKWFNNRKGYGFIEPDDETMDMFVHYTAIQGNDREFRTLYENDKVEYEIEDGQKGPQASNVKIIEQAPRPIRPKPQTNQNIEK